MSDEILKQILDKLNQIETNMATKKDLTDTRVQMNARFDTTEMKLSRVENDVADIKAAVGRIEADSPQDIMGMLKQINAKLDANQDLASKVEDLETDVKLIKKAITNQ